MSEKNHEENSQIEKIIKEEKMILLERAGKAKLEECGIDKRGLAIIENNRTIYKYLCIGEDYVLFQVIRDGSPYETNKNK